MWFFVFVMVVTTHAPAPVVSAENRKLLPNGHIGCVSKKATRRQQKRLRCGDYKVRLADHNTFLGKERNTYSESGRVEGYVFDPRLDGFDPYKQCGHVLDGSRMGKSNREAIDVQTSSQNMDGEWCGNKEWGTIERFKFDKNMVARIRAFVQFQSRHYGDLRKHDTHFGTLGGAGLRAWNGSVVGEYAPTRGGGTIKNVSQFRLQGAAKEMRELFKHSSESYDSITALQSVASPYGNCPYFYAWSQNLGNATHVDPNDIHQSFAIFTLSKSANPRSLGYDLVKAGTQVSWYLLFPINGVAVKLEDGVGVTWPGNNVPHCSSIPIHTHDCLSLFTTLNWPIEKCFTFQGLCNEMQVKLTLAGHPMENFYVGQQVAVLTKNRYLSRAATHWWSRYIVIGIKQTIGGHSNPRSPVQVGDLQIMKETTTARQGVWVDKCCVVPCPW
jgi:hypothetical protein